MRLWAHHYGAPQMRERVFVVATLDGGDALRRAVEGIRARVVSESQRLTVGDIARWDEGKWRPVEQCGDRAGSRGGKSKESSRDRILRGLDLGVDQWWGQHVTGHHGKPIDTPLSTLTRGDQHVLCRRSDRSTLGIEYRPLLIREMLAVQGFPEHYKLPPKLKRKHACRAIGNAVAVPVARAIAESIMEAST